MTRQRRIILTLLCALPFSQGCDNGSPVSSDSDVYYTSISRMAMVVPENDAFYLHHTDGDEYVFYCWNEQGGISRERFIAGTGLGGYLRRITEVRREGRFYYVMTSPATFTEVFRRGRLDISFEEITGGPGKSRIDLSGMDLYIPPAPQNGTGIRIEEGHIAFSPEVSVQIGVIDQDVREISVTVDGPLEFRSSMTADIDGEFEVEAGIESAVFSERQVLYCGSLPVVVDVEISFTAMIYAKGGFCDSCRYDLLSSGTVHTGAEYSGGSWRETDETELAFAASSLACSDYADGGITVDLVPKISVSFYGQRMFTIDVSQHQTVSSSTGTRPDWAWEISGGPCNSFAFDEGILGGRVPRFESEVGCEGSTLRSGPYRSDGYIFVTGWGTEGAGDGRFLFPSGIAAGPDGSIYVCDRTANRISRFAADSTFIGSWGGTGTGEGLFSFPAGIAAGPGGDVFVVDRGNRRVQRFDSDGTFILSWGSYGDGDGQFREPEGITISDDGTVFVTDNFANRVQKFSVDGVFAGTWGSTGTGGGLLNGPVGIACDASGDVYISECYNNRVQRFTSDGVFVLSWGTPGPGESQFACPSGVLTAPGGLVYVSDYGNDRVQVFDSVGSFIASFGLTGDGQGGFDGPYGLTIDGQGDIYITDSGNNRVQRYSLLH